MAEINSIPYENAEDLKTFLYDNFYSTEHIELTTIATGFLYNLFGEMRLTTGTTASSTCMTNYDIASFNPLYSEAVWKGYVDSMDNCFAFFGFKESLAAPTFDMTESHAGFMIYDDGNGGKIYASVADGTEQQRVELIGIDAARVENYKVAYNAFFVEPLPAVETSLGLPGVLTTFPYIKREWVEMTRLTNYPPKNEVHYIVQYIENGKNNLNKILTLNRFIYSEVYAD